MQKISMPAVTDSDKDVPEYDLELFSRCKLLDGDHIENSYYLDDEYHQEELENIQLYTPGGFHPVKPGDFIGEDDRFDVWHKLGQGSFGIVWLCRDRKQEKFRAIKVLRADISSRRDLTPELRIQDLLDGVSVDEAWRNHVVMPLEHFWESGPNGNHLCLVMPLLGPSITESRTKQWNNVPFLKDICFQLVEGMEFLHSRGLCHGDFRPSNILFKTTLEDLTEDEMEVYMPAPVGVPIWRLDSEDDEPGGPHAPIYAIKPLEFDLEDKYISRDIAIIDFGVAFEASDPPDQSSIPYSWAAPEVQAEIDSRPSKGSDLWALGCTIAEVLNGGTPWCMGDSFSFSLVEDALGPVPEPWRTNLLMSDHYGLYEHTSDLSLPVTMTVEGIEKQRAQREQRFGTRDCLVRSIAAKHYYHNPDWNPESAEAAATADSDAKYQGPEQAASGSESDPEDNDPRVTKRQLDPAAVPGAVDLLRKVFKWLPADRIAAKDLLDHEWFDGRHQTKPGVPEGLMFEDMYFLMDNIPLGEPTNSLDMDVQEQPQPEAPAQPGLQMRDFQDISREMFGRLSLFVGSFMCGISGMR